MRRTFNKILKPTGYRITKVLDAPPPHPTPLKTFHSHFYLRHNARRLEHLASLQLPLAGKSVLEVGAGTGDHTHFFTDRGCRVLVTDTRAENLELIRERYPQLIVQALNMEQPQLAGDEKFDIVYCYGLLYHLSNPGGAIAFMAQRSRGLLLLETCVSYGDDAQINLCVEDPEDPSQGFYGEGCRPTRPWVFAEIKKHFPFTYMPLTQPWHEEFPLDWTGPPPATGLVRSIFIGSHEPLTNEFLTGEIPAKQTRH